MPIGLPRPAAPDPMTDMKRRITELEGIVSRLINAPSLENATIGQGGIRIINGGTVQVIDVSGNVAAIIGALPSQYNRADGSPQPGLMFSRPDGTVALLLGDRNATTPPYSAAFQVIDRLGGRVVVADDTNSGHGLANPHVPAILPVNTNIATWPATTAAVWTDIADCFYEVQNPCLQWSITMQADTATTGQFRLMVNGTQVGTTQTVTGGFATWAPVAVSLLSFAPVGSIVPIELDAQRTAGTGTIRAVFKWMEGTQS